MRKIVNRSRFTGYKGMRRIITTPKTFQMTALSTKEKLSPMVAAMVDDKVNEMFRTAHRCAGTQSGDIDPHAELFLDAVKEALTAIIVGQTLSNVPDTEDDEGNRIIAAGLTKMAEFFKPISQPAKTLVIVKGGLVTGAWSNRPDMEIEIKDFDNEPGENWQDEDKSVEELSKGMTAIY